MFVLKHENLKNYFQCHRDIQLTACNKYNSKKNCKKKNTTLFGQNPIFLIKKCQTIARVN